MRAEKRKKNAPKELARLKQALGLDQKGEAIMSEVQEIATVVPADKIKKQTDEEMVEAEGDGECGPHTESAYCQQYGHHSCDRETTCIYCLVCHRREDGHGQ